MMTWFRMLYKWKMRSPIKEPAHVRMAVAVVFVEMLVVVMADVAEAL